MNQLDVLVADFQKKDVNAFEKLHQLYSENIRGAINVIVKDEEIVAFEHEGFFEPMDTYREYLKLNKLWNLGNAPWE